MSGFNSSSEGDFDRVFMTSSEFFDQFVGEQLWTCGYNTQGQLGNGNADTSNKSIPVTVAGGRTDWTQVSCGGDTSAAIKTDGTLWAWGFNDYGQLGDGTIGTKRSPVSVIGIQGQWKFIACGGNHTAAIKTDGTLWTWGRNDSGGLGSNNTSSYSSPVSVVGGANWKQVACSMSRLATGKNYTAAIKTDGTLWTWGSNTAGQLGDGTTTSRSSPGTTAGGGTNWKQVACNTAYDLYFSTAAVKTDGTLWTWGMNQYGQLGDGTTTSRSSPGTTAGGGTNWKQVSCGYNYCAAVKIDGTLWTWGHNQFQILADAPGNSNRSSPVTTVAGGTNWKQVSCSQYGSIAAIKTDGTLWTWGNNGYGQLGDGTTSSRSSPVSVVTGTNWKKVSVGTSHLAAIGY